MKITIEPTDHLYSEVGHNDHQWKSAIRKWQGKTEDGVEVEVYVIAVSARYLEDGRKLRTKVPADMLRERRLFRLTPREPITHDDKGPLFKEDLDANALRDGKLLRQKT